jgi:hypothetical protein
MLTAPQPAQFIAAFGGEDPGRTDIVPALFKQVPANMYVSPHAALVRPRA